MVFIRRFWRSCTFDMSEGGERLDHVMSVSPRIDPIHGMVSFKEDAPPNGMWM